MKSCNNCWDFLNSLFELNNKSVGSEAHQLASTSTPSNQQDRPFVLDINDFGFPGTITLTNQKPNKGEKQK